MFWALRNMDERNVCFSKARDAFKVLALCLVAAY